MTQKVSEYTLIARGSPADLTESVNEHIRNGWQPFESPSHCYQSGGNWWMQPMVIYQVETPKKAGK